MAYLLDSNTFIQAKNDYYSFDVVPAYWDWIEASSKQNTVFSIDRVQKESIDKTIGSRDFSSTRIPAP